MPAPSVVFMHVEPVKVMVWFGRPIEPEPVASFIRVPRATGPPLDVDELEGELVNWQKRREGWHGMVNYRYPTQGIGMQNYIGWFPASRLRLDVDRAAASIDVRQPGSVLSWITRL